MVDPVETQTAPIPDAFRKGTMPPVGTVEELMGQLAQLPPDLPCESRYRLCVTRQLSTGELFLEIDNLG